MDPFLVGILGITGALLLIALRVPIAFALGTAAGVAIYCFFAFPASGDPRLAMAIRPALTLVYSNIYSLFHSYAFSAIPMFIALGHICYRSGITRDIYDACRVWLARLPGGLAIATLIGCGGFSAISGSSVACAATMGRVCVPEMMRFGYSDKLAGGAVAAGGTLGALIPPSILFILYGIFAEQSISALFLAGVVPGLISLAGYILVVIIWSLLDPSIAPAADRRFTLAERLRMLVRTWPAVLIFTVIFGGIYRGIFTATEAAAVSLAVALLVSVARRAISWSELIESFRETAFQSGAIFLIAGAAKIFVSFISLTGVSNALVAFVGDTSISLPLMILGIVAIYIVLGMFLDPVGIMLLTLPFMLPLVEGAGLDLIWFGVIVVKLLEMGLITPPVGLNVFVVASVVEDKVSINRIFAGVTRFFAMDVVVLILLIALPVLSLYLPMSMR